MNNNSYDFMNDKNFVKIAKAYNDIRNRTSVTSLPKMKVFLNAYYDAKRAIKPKEGKVSYEIDKNYSDIGYITIESAHLKNINRGYLILAAENADLFDITPKTNGVFEISLTFYGLTVPVEEIAEG